MLSLVGKQTEVRKYIAKDWDAQREEITRLYENNTLEGVVNFMKKNMGLMPRKEPRLSWYISATDSTQSKTGN
jgi:hypothetical protein